MVFAAQPQWFAKVDALSSEQKAAMEKMTDAQRLRRYSEIAGFAQLAGHFGVTPAGARQCLADPKGLERLLNGTKAAEDGESITRRPS